MNNIKRVSIFEKEGEERISVKKETVNYEFVEEGNGFKFVGNRNVVYMSELIREGNVAIKKIELKLIEIKGNNELENFQNRLIDVKEKIEKEVDALEIALREREKEEDILNKKREANYEIINKIVSKIESIEDIEEYEYLLEVEGYKIYDIGCDYDVMKQADNELYYFINDDLEFSIVYDELNNVNIYVVNYNKFHMIKTSFYINRIDELLSNNIS